MENESLLEKRQVIADGFENFFLKTTRGKTFHQNKKN